MGNFSKYLFIAIAGLLMASCNMPPKATENRTSDSVYVDREFTAFFARDCCGVTGADGFYSVPLPDGRVVWIFGDSFLGLVNLDGSREKRSPVFIRNAFAVQDGDSLISLYQIIDGWESSFVIPPDAVKGTEFSEDSLWYWPGDGFVENGKLKVFMTAFYQAEPGNWGFRWTGVNLATFSLPDIKLEKIDQLDYPGEVEIHWGHAICDEAPDYTYIYGTGNKFPYVARAPKSNILLPWEFYSGKRWEEDSRLAKPMTDFESSEQFSVFKLDGKFVFLSQKGGFSNEIHTCISDNPYGGWHNPKCIYSVPAFKNEHLFSYNAIAHPQFTNNNGLLVSFCVNSFEMEDVFMDANNYRPRFIRVPVESILE